MKFNKILLPILLCTSLFATSCSGMQNTSSNTTLDETSWTTTENSNVLNTTEPSTSNIEPSTSISTEQVTQKSSAPRDIHSAREYALAFIEEAYSIHSPLEFSSWITDDTPNWQEYLGWRRNTILNRREIFGNQKKLTNIEVEYEDVKETNDFAIVLFDTLEEFHYIDEPDMPATSRSTYILLLHKDNGKYSVAWTFDGGSISRIAQGNTEAKRGYETRPYLRVASIHIPFVSEESPYKRFSEIDVSTLFYLDMIRDIENFPYHDFTDLNQLEAVAIAQDQKAMGIEEDVLAYDPNSGLEALDREKMAKYIETYAMSRNNAWVDISAYGGDCQNFASQVLYEGGAPMTISGDYHWYFNSLEDRSPAWTGVDFMYDFIRLNRGQGPQGIETNTWRQLDIGDMILIDWTYDGVLDHTTTVNHSGKQARVSGHTRDNYNERISDLGGLKFYIHVKGYQK